MKRWATPIKIISWSREKMLIIFLPIGDYCQSAQKFLQSKNPAFLFKVMDFTKFGMVFFTQLLRPS